MWVMNKIIRVSLIGNGYLKNSSTPWPSPEYSSSYKCLYEVAWGWAYGCWYFRALILKAIESTHIEAGRETAVRLPMQAGWRVISQGWGPAPKPLSFCKEPVLPFLPVQCCVLRPLLWKTHPRPACLSSIIKRSSLHTCQQQLLLLMSIGTLR